jgi:regulatory protein
VVVEVDGIRLATLPAEDLRALSLEIGTELSPAQHEAVLRSAGLEAARRVALRLLASRPRAARDLKRRLRERGHDPKLIDEMIVRLEASGLVNDDNFARHFVRVRGPRGHGPARLVHDLLALGVERRTAEGAVADVSEAEGIDPAGIARDLAAKRAAQLGKIPAERKRRRLLNYLARRGFQGRDIREMVTKLVR